MTPRGVIVFWSEPPPAFSTDRSSLADTPACLGIGKESGTSKPATTFPYVPAVQAEERIAEWDFQRCMGDRIEVY